MRVELPSSDWKGDIFSGANDFHVGKVLGHLLHGRELCFKLCWVTKTEQSEVERLRQRVTMRTNTIGDPSTFLRRSWVTGVLGIGVLLLHAYYSIIYADLK